MKSLLIEFKFIFKLILKNQKRFLKSKFGRHQSLVGATHKNISIEQSLLYIKNVFNDYLKYGKITTDDLKGKIILELGPGDNFGIALLFLTFGAKKVYLLDKFFSERDNIQQLKIYKVLRDTLSDEAKISFDTCITLDDNEVKINSDKLEYIYGYGIEDSKQIFKNNSFDIIVSRAVIQEISKTKKAFKVMHSNLRTGGFMLHKIDLRDYGMFTKFKNHQLGFLMFPSFVYKLMTNHSGLPNRMRVSYYKKLLTNLNFKSTIFITHIFGLEEQEFVPHQTNIVYNVDYNDDNINYIEQVRGKLASEFKKLPIEDLLISGIFVKSIKE